MEFLEHLMRHIPGKLLIIWDRLSAHRSAFVRDFIAAQDGRITLEWLPAYAPELNPVEYCGAIGKITSSPTSVRSMPGSSAQRLGAASDESGAGHP